VPETRHACEAILGYDVPQPMSTHERHTLDFQIPIWLDGRAEDRGIEPLRLRAAVQRFAGVPNTHIGKCPPKPRLQLSSCIAVTSFVFVTDITLFQARAARLSHAPTLCIDLPPPINRA
jgi:hypothetical protein